MRDFFLFSKSSQQQSDPKEQVKEQASAVSVLSDNKDGDDTNDDEWYGVSTHIANASKLREIEV